MERRTRGILVLLGAAGLVAATGHRTAASTLLTFENTNTTTEQPLYGYGGLQWQNVQTMNTDWFVRDGGPINGYVTGAVSPPTVAWVPEDGLSNRASATLTSSAPFELKSAYLTSAWNDNLLLQVNAYLNGQPVGSRTIALNPSSPTMVNFNFPLADTVRLSASGGTPDPAFAPPLPPQSILPTPEFVIDNVTVDGPGVTPTPLPNPVPEPSALAVAGLLAAAGWWLRRKRACV
jgi:hypothetical protein